MMDMQKQSFQAAASVSVQYDSAFSPFPARQFPDALAWARESGFDGVELILCDPQEADPQALGEALAANGLRAAAIATGQAAGLRGLSLASADAQIRHAAERRLLAHVALAARVGFPGVTIGSLLCPAALWRKGIGAQLLKQVDSIADYAAGKGVRLNIEAINRYESGLLHTVAEVLDFLRALGDPSNVGVLFDTFHANIEEADMASAVRAAGKRLFHVHFADSNRRLPRKGHIDFAPIAAALRETGYAGFISLENLWAAADGEEKAAALGDLTRILKR